MLTEHAGSESSGTSGADFEKEKKHAAECCLEYLRDGMTIGLGTGTTASYFIAGVGRRVAQGLQIRAIPTSLRTETLARKLGIPLTDFGEVKSLDLTVDGADEVDIQLNLIKGGGGALLREKIVASASNRLIIIGDSRKFVDRLGTFPLPVEVIRFGWQLTAERIAALGAEVQLRSNTAGQPFLTVENNYILDCSFGAIEDAPELAREIRRITGAVEHGLFIEMASELVLGSGEGTEVITRSLRRKAGDPSS
jgi:ribose 5-phosphate isomerase A